MREASHLWAASGARWRQWRLSFREFERDRVALASLIVLLFIVAVTSAAPWLPLDDPAAFAHKQYLPPSAEHWMGTDNFGRSMLSRVIWGGRLAIQIGLFSAGIALVLGAVLGAVSGYFAGWLDDALSRLFDIFLMIPAFFLALVVVMLFGSNIYLIIVVIGLTMWPRTARIMRAQVLTLKHRQYVHASRVSGASHLQVLFRHVAPNGVGPVITEGAILMGVAILIEAALSFLGLGDPSTISWGRMIFIGQEHLRVAPWMSFFPGLAMLILVCALNLVGDGLNTAINPQMRERSSRSIARLLRRQPGPHKVPDVGKTEVTGAERPLLEVRNLSVFYALDQGFVRAVDDVSFAVRRGESLGLVGESGCGKTSLGLALMRILPSNARVMQGEVYLTGAALSALTQAQFQEMRWKRISMVFQSSMNSLNPVKRVGDQLTEAYALHRPAASRAEAAQRSRELFEVVGIPVERLRAYPHEMSGGMRQRVIIALALLLNPELIIADEPTTALDVLVKDQILAELDRLRTQLNLGMILVSHDMGVVAETCDRIAVMYAGQIVEEAPSGALFENPRHPYTRGLIGSLPTLSGPKEELLSIPGDSILAVGNLPPCRFSDRCPARTELCATVTPPWVEIDKWHRVRCHYAASPAIETVWDRTVAS